LTASLLGRICALILLAVLAAPAPVLAQDPFGPLPDAAPTPTPEPIAIQDESDPGDVSPTILLVIGGGLLAVFLVIGRAIIRDARRRSPAEARHGPALREEGPHKHGRQAKAKARARGKSQRAARRRNR
jgi:hypothetical protein